MSLKGMILKVDLGAALVDYLDVGSCLNLSATSRFFYKQLQGKSYWRNALYQLGYDRQTLQRFFSSRQVVDYRTLYRNFSSLPRLRREALPFWAMACLSGEGNLIQAMLESEELKETARLKDGTHPLHWLARSGSRSALAIGSKAFPALVDQCDAAGYGVLHYAAQSPDLQIVEACLDDLELKIDVSDTTLAFCAALSGYPHKLEQVLERFSIDSDCVDKGGWTLLHHAAFSGSLRMVSWCHETLNISLLLKEECGATALHLGAFSGDCSLMDYLSGTGEFTMTMTAENDLTPLHYAAMSGCVDTMAWCVKQAPELVGCRTQKEGYSVLEMAVMSGKMAAVDYCLDTLDMPFDLEQCVRLAGDNKDVVNRLCRRREAPTEHVLMIRPRL